MLTSLAWFLQLIALVIVGASLLLGLAYDQVRMELGFTALGAILFLLGRWLQGRAGAGR